MSAAAASWPLSPTPMATSWGCSRILDRRSAWPRERGRSRLRYTLGLAAYVGT